MKIRYNENREIRMRYVYILFTYSFDTLRSIPTVALVQ
jgi:hypothetical protein